MSEHLKPKQALFCSNASQGGLPGEGCWTMTRVLDWTPLPQLLSQLDHSDHAESWQSTTAKNNHTWWITWELTHLSKICKKRAIWLLGTIPWFALKTCFILWQFIFELISPKETSRMKKKIKKVLKLASKISTKILVLKFLVLFSNYHSSLWLTMFIKLLYKQTHFLTEYLWCK